MDFISFSINVFYLSHDPVHALSYFRSSWLHSLLWSMTVYLPLSLMTLIVLSSSGQVILYYVPHSGFVWCWAHNYNEVWQFCQEYHRGEVPIQSGRIKFLGYPYDLYDINIHHLVMVVFITLPHVLFFLPRLYALKEWFNVLKASFDYYLGNRVGTRRQLGGWCCKQGKRAMLLTVHFSGMNPHVN